MKTFYSLLAEAALHNGKNIYLEARWPGLWDHPGPQLEVTIGKSLYLPFLIQKERWDMVMAETTSGSLSVELSGT